MLKKLGIVKSKTKGYHVFMEHIAPDFMSNTMGPSEYVRYCWNNYENSGVERNNSLNGTIFELIIATLFVKEGILPLHLQAQVAFVPNVNFDAVLYTHETGPIGLSLKTSLRERYKQADLEAVAADTSRIQLNITAYAIQKEGVNTAADAWSKINAQ